MNMIRYRLTNGDSKEKVKTAWFNTWQFSQFELDDFLTINLLSCLVNELHPNPKMSEKFKKILSTLGSVTVKAVNSFLYEKSGVNFMEASDKQETMDMVQSVIKLKDFFQICINEQLSKEERFVIFIDDLDRLPPQRAVEVLEVLKLFLDCEGCVFVLAIDYEVVCRGINIKYGNTIDEEKGHSFFDKIIQVPFKMPVAHYNINKYIKDSLKLIGLDESELKIESYVALLNASVGYNPRSIKRLLSSFLLLKMIYETEDIMNDEDEQLILFATLCLQMSYEDIYNSMVLKTDNVFTRELFNELKKEQLDADDFENNCESIKRFLKLLQDLGLKDKIKDIGLFMANFSKTLAEENAEIDNKTYEKLNKILDISGITANVSATGSNGKRGKGIRYNKQYDDAFSEHSIDERVKWEGCKIQSYMLDDGCVDVSNFTQLMGKVLEEFYKKDPNKFQEIYNEATGSDPYRLYSLFFGTKTKEEYDAPLEIPQIDFVEKFQIETKNSCAAKMKFLCGLAEGMGYNPKKIKLNVKLAHLI